MEMHFDFPTIIHPLVPWTTRSTGNTLTTKDSRFSHRILETGAMIRRDIVDCKSRILEFERSLIRERQREGVAIAKAKGLYRGRKQKLNATQIEEAKTKIALGVSKARIAREIGITRMTLYNSIGK